MSVLARWQTRRIDLDFFSVKKCAADECSRLSRLFNRGTLLNASEAQKFEKRVIDGETRAGLHKVVG